MKNASFYLNKTIGILSSFLIAIKYILAYFCARLFYTKVTEQKIWLISERENEARDNGYHLFQYIRTFHPETHCFYVISPAAKDRTRIEHLGNLIKYDSFKHYIYYFCAKYCISTHIYGYVPHRPIFNRLDKIFRVNKKRIFLQHGIIMHFHKFNMFEVTNVDLHVCSTTREHQFIIEKNHYPETVAKCIGLARYDNLFEFKTKKQILIMPTWRSYLYQATNNQFLDSEFYEKYQKLFNDKKICRQLEEYGYTLFFYPHYELQKFMHLFTTGSDKIVIARHEMYDVQELLKESELLITDYSSVHFDFAYMKKPIFYFQYDRDDFYKKHYQKGYFDFYEDGFGEVIMNESLLKERLSEFLSLGIKTFDNTKYNERIDKFFCFRDTKYCERNFDAIIKL